MGSKLIEGAVRTPQEAIIKRVAAISLVAALLISLTSAPVSAAPEGTIVQTYEKLPEFPVDMAWVPGTETIYYTEKDTGKIRVLRRGTLLARACRNLSVNYGGEQGALGIALHPDFANNKFLYVYFSSKPGGDNRIARFTVVRRKCTNMRVIFDGIPDKVVHNGGQLEFQDGHLFVTTGDAENPAASQNQRSLAGKVLRLKPNGSIPDDNPFQFPTGHPAVWSYGHRNGFGLAARPNTGQLFQSENGPGCDDELNAIVAGANYGWGADYDCDGPAVGINPVPPLRSWSPTIAPTDMTWYEGRVDALRGGLLMSDYNDGNIHRFTLNKAGTAIIDESIVHDTNTSLMDVEKGPGGWVYFLTPGAIRRIREVP